MDAHLPNMRYFPAVAEQLNFTRLPGGADLPACAWPTSPAAAGRSPRLRSIREAVDAGVDEGLHGVAAVVSPPGDRELGRAEVGDRDADDAGAGVDHRVPLGEQGHRRAGGDYFEGFVSRGHLGRHGRCLPGSLTGGEPEVPQRPGGERQGREWFIGYLRERDVVLSGEGVAGAKRDEAALGD